MKVLEVEYNNYTFRSKTEAKWAKLMDELSIEYIYEPDTYVLDHVNANNKRLKIRYLPDFYLTKQKLFLEIKNNGNKKPTLDESLKAYLLSISSKTPVVIAFGDVTHKSNTSYGNYFYYDKGNFDMHYRLTKCTTCSYIDFTKFGNVYDVHCECTKEDRHRELYNTSSLENAFDKVKSFRFGW